MDVGSKPKNFRSVTVVTRYGTPWISLALRSGRRDDVHRPGNLFGQPVVAEGAVVADVHRLGDVGGDEVLVGGVHGLLAGVSGMMRYVPGKSRSSQPFSVSREAISRAVFGGTSSVVSMSSTEMIW